MRLFAGMYRGDRERGIALATAKHDIAMRLRRVCENFDEADFRALVERIAEIDVRYRMRDEWTFVPAQPAWRTGMN